MLLASCLHTTYLFYWLNRTNVMRDQSVENTPATCHRRKLTKLHIKRWLCTDVLDRADRVRLHADALPMATASKLGISDRTQAVVRALEPGILEVP